MLFIFVEAIIFFSTLCTFVSHECTESLEIEFLCNIVNVFTVTFYNLMLNKLFKKNNPTLNIIIIMNVYSFRLKRAF